MAEKKYVEIDQIVMELKRFVGYLDADMLYRLEIAVKRLPAADVVSRGAYDQTDWERCVALTQLKEIGKSLGERMDDVRPVVLCRDCKCNNACLTQAFVEDASRVPFDRNTFFCADGKRADDA